MNRCIILCLFNIFDIRKKNIVIRKSDGTKTSYDLYKLLVDGNRIADVTLDAGDTVLVNGTVNFDSYGDKHNK